MNASNGKPKALQDQAYEILKNRIIACEYQPGAFLSILALQDEFGFSRTPIREAVGRLEQENLVRVIPKKGMVVQELDLRIMKTIYETRLLLEPYIIGVYGGLLDKGVLKQIRRRFSGKEVSPDTREHFFLYDDGFHDFIRSVCPNIYFTQALEQIAAQNCRVRVLSGNVVSRLESSCDEHIAIIDALLEDNLPLAQSAMVKHLESSREIAFSLILNTAAPGVL